jgi:nucleoside phosphorylase
MIAFVFATPHEGRDLVAKVKDKDIFYLDTLQCITGQLGGRKVVVAFVGMGMERAGVHSKILLSYFRLKGLVLGGYGGGLVSQLKKGQVVVANNYTTEEVQHFLRFIPGFDFATFCTATGLVATVEHKQEFARLSQAQVVDMESAAVAVAAEERQVPFIAVRAISDELEEALPTEILAAGFDPETNSARPFGFVCGLLRHPTQIMTAYRFISKLSLVRKKLTEFLLILNVELPKTW